MIKKFYFVIVLFALFFLGLCNAGPAAVSFTISPAIGCNTPHTVFFTDTTPDDSSPTTVWNWDFGDGNTANFQNPVYSYNATGEYTVSLNITNDEGYNETATDVVTISIPTVDFIANGSVFGGFGCGPLAVDFEDIGSVSGASASNWLWDFGDGNTSNLQNPQHIYQNPGIYNVSLTTTDTNGCFVTENKPAFVQVIGPDVSFITSQISDQAPSDVDFTDTTIFGAPIVQWDWDFGDGNSSNLQNPNNTYETEGVYTPTLTVSDIDGCDRTADNGSITVIADQAITFNDPADQVYSVGGTFNAPANSDSGLPVSITSNNSNVCTVSGQTVSIQSVGNCSLTASQAGSDIYNPAVDVNQVVMIAQASQVITFDDPPNQVYSVGSTFNVIASSDSGLLVMLVSNDSNVCTVAGFVVTMVAVGECSLTASQAGNTNFLPANDVVQTVVILPADTDGVDDVIENAVPDADGVGFGDGDGNGVMDSTESQVASFLALNGVDYLTVKSNYPLSGLSVSSQALTGLTERVYFPYDFLGFTVNGIGANETIIIDLFVPYRADISGYWKMGNDGQWENLATNVAHINNIKTQITIEVVEGGNFDMDSEASSLSDPGAVGVQITQVPFLSPFMFFVLLILTGVCGFQYIRRL